MNNFSLHGYVLQPRAFISLACVMALALAAMMGAAPSAQAANGSQFKDVPPTAKFYTEITWLAEQQITKGYSDGGFHPKESVSREAFAAFLYRLAGKPKVTLPSRSPFKDVKKSDQFYKEIVWLSKKGISTGYANGTFKPSDKITREAIAAFLYRFEEKPSFKAPTKSPFKDMKTSSKFYKEVTWLSKSGMTTGYSDKTFRPKINVSREAIAAFLYRGNTILKNDGAYEVGSDIKPGSYTAIISTEDGCYWSRWTDESLDLEQPEAFIYISEGARNIVTIDADDLYFYTEGCSGWTPLRATSPTATTVGDGAHLQGFHMRAGTYKAPGGSQCTWFHFVDFLLDENSILASGFEDQNPPAAKLVKGQAGLVTFGCGDWKRISS